MDFLQCFSGGLTRQQDHVFLSDLMVHLKKKRIKIQVRWCYPSDTVSCGNLLRNSIITNVITKRIAQF